MTLKTVLLSLAAVGALAAACGGGDSEEPKTLAAQPTAADSGGSEMIEGTNQAKLADPGQATEIVFSTDGSGFSGPDSTSAGWTRILLENTGQEDQHLGLVLLTEGKTAADLRAFVEEKPTEPLPSWAVQSGGPVDVSPGVTGSVTQELQAGNYALVTYALDENEMSRVTSEMLRAFTVNGSGTAGTEPTPDVTLTISDFDYVIRNTGDLFGQATGKAIDPGSRIVQVNNAGTRVFEARVSRTEPGKQAADFPELYVGRQEMGGGQGMGSTAMGRMLPFPVIKDDGTGPGGPPPGTSIGGVMAIQPGGRAYFAAELTPANYFIYNLLEDVELGTSYLMRPMAIEFPVR